MLYKGMTLRIQSRINQGVLRALNELLRFTCYIKRRKPFKSLSSDMSYIIENIRLSKLRPSGNLLHHPYPSLSTFELRYIPPLSYF